MPGPGIGKDGVCLTLSRNGYDGSISVYGPLSDWTEDDRTPDGVIFATAELIEKYMGYADEDYPRIFDGKTREQVVTEQLKSEVHEYSNWAVGNVWGYVLYEAKKEHITVTDLTTGDTTEDKDRIRWEEVDACWGFITDNPEKDVPEWGQIVGYTGEEIRKELVERLEYR